MTEIKLEIYVLQSPKKKKTQMQDFSDKFVYGFRRKKKNVNEERRKNQKETIKKNIYANSN